MAGACAQILGSGHADPGSAFLLSKLPARSPSDLSSPLLVWWVRRLLMSAFPRDPFRPEGPQQSVCIDNAARLCEATFCDPSPPWSKEL